MVAHYASDDEVSQLLHVTRVNATPEPTIQTECGWCGKQRSSALPSRAQRRLGAALQPYNIVRAAMGVGVSTRPRS
jgi:hypothetical protein